MRIVKFFVCCAAVLLHAFLYSLDKDSCEAFGNRAHMYSQNLYMASLNVGTGECHVVRQGDQVVMFDAGYRNASVDADHIVECLDAMMSHAPVPREKATLGGIFITHAHNDHLNLVKPILDSDIHCSKNFRIYLGGARNGTYDQLVDDSESKMMRISDTYSKYPVDSFYVAGGNVSTLDRLDEESANDYGGMFFLDCFTEWYLLHNF